MSNNKKKKELAKLLKASIKEMEDQRLVLLTQGELIQDDDDVLYKQMYQIFLGLEKQLCDEVPVETVLKEKKNWMDNYESFFMNLFETRRFKRMFDLFEYE